jgi:uncharacterized damage-inducible protein DinB
MGIAMDAPVDRAGTLTSFHGGLAALEAAVSGLSDDALDAVPSSGGWTVRQIVHHLADGDDIWKLAIKIAIGHDDAAFDLGWYQVMPQQEWADRWAYGSRPIHASLSLLKASREHVLQLLDTTPDAWHRAVLLRKPDGQMERIPVGFIVGMQAEHVFHHLKRIQEILNQGRGT